MRSDRFLYQQVDSPSPSPTTLMTYKEDESFIFSPHTIELVITGQQFFFKSLLSAVAVVERKKERERDDP